MASMVAVDEFELDSASARPAARAGTSRRRRGDQPAAWVALAVAAVGIGSLAVPPVLPRATAELVDWGGLNGVTYVTVDDDVDALSFARDAVDFFASYDSEGRPTGTVVVLFRHGTDADDQDPTGVVDSADAAVEMTFDSDLFVVLEAAAPRSDWLCEPSAGEALCTALADPETTVVIGWPNL